MPFELRPEPHPTLRPEGDYLQRAWQQSVYPLARQMSVPITLPPVSPQPHTHLAFEGYQYAKEHGKGNEYNHRVLEAFFQDGQDIGDADVLTRLRALAARRKNTGYQTLLKTFVAERLYEEEKREGLVGSTTPT